MIRYEQAGLQKTPLLMMTANIIEELGINNINVWYFLFLFSFISYVCHMEALWKEKN